MPNSILADLLASVTEKGRAFLGLGEPEKDPARQAASLVSLCEQVLSGRGEASGAALAREVLDRYAMLDADARATFFTALAEKFGPDQAALKKSVEEWTQTPGPEQAARLHLAAEARRQELFRRLNRAPGGTAALVDMREKLLDAANGRAELKGVDQDFTHLFSSWFNRGFLVLRRIDWSSPANVLEKIIRYEAVHEIRDWDDLRRRIDPPDRRCYAFFHPALVDEPLIFVEVALTKEIPAAIQPLLASERKIMATKDARTAVFYSISNCQPGLAGVSFGNFLIKQVVEELRRELPKIETFVTLSPVPGFMRWLKGDGQKLIEDNDRKLLDTLDQPNWSEDTAQAAKLRALIEPLAAYYFLEARTAQGRARDPVARFHLGNGARLERINWLGDTSAKGMKESAGVMVNYLYDLDDIETNHEAYANQGELAAASTIRRSLRNLKLPPAGNAA